MKWRAIDSVDNEKPNECGVGNTAAAKDEAAQVIQIPPLSFATAADESMASDAGTPPDTENSATANGAAVVTDPELLELLEQLSTTIDSANTVLDAASTLPAEQAAGRVSDPESEPAPRPEPAPQPEPEADDPPPLAVQSVSPSPPRPAGARAAFGFGVMVNTALTALVFFAGGAWLLYTNPWILEPTPNAPVKLERTEHAPLVKDQSAPTHAPAPRVQSPNGTADVADLPQTSVTPPAPQPVATPSLQIGGAAGQPIALGIALPAMANPTELSVMIQGVPEKVKLSAGNKLGAGSWLLNEPQLQGLTLNTTEDFAPGTYELEVIFVRSDGKVPETRKVMLAVQPAADTAAATVTKQLLGKARPGAENMQTTFMKTGVAVEVPTDAPGQTTPAPAKQVRISVKPNKPALTPQESQNILLRGDTLLREGDVAGARLLFEYAAERGGKKAMVKLGESYDAKYLRKLGVHGIQPDDTQAAHWYERASEAQ